MNLLGWAMATAVALAVVYGLHDATRGNPLTADSSAAYNALHGTAWAVSVCWVIFACSNGYGGMFLSAPRAIEVYCWIWRHAFVYTTTLQTPPQTMDVF